MSHAVPKQHELTRQQYESWKRLVPYLYDWCAFDDVLHVGNFHFPSIPTRSHTRTHTRTGTRIHRFENHALIWPSLSIQWGPILTPEEEVSLGVTNRAAKSRFMDDPSGAKGTSFTFSAENMLSTSDVRSLYISEQTDGSAMNTLCMAYVDMPQQHAAGPVNLAAMGASSLQQTSSPNVKVLKTIVHPGEVNKVVSIPVPNFRHVVATHTDSPEVYIWNFNTQPNREEDLREGEGQVDASVADAVLVGHEDNAEFAMGTSGVKPLIASGGKDMKVLVWDLEGSLGMGKVPPSVHLEGHTNTVEDVCFKPENQFELVSVADDYSMLFWDTRSNTKPVDRVPNAHGNNDLHSVDWSLMTPHQLVTGAQDGGVYVWDRRNLSVGPTHKFMHHYEAVTKVEWSPHVPSVLASGSDDGVVAIWDLNKRAVENRSSMNLAVPEELVIQHAGHTSSVVDFSWNPDDPWTLMSTSVNSPGAGPMPINGGGALQFWRVSEIVYKSEEELMQQLAPYVLDENRSESLAETGTHSGILLPRSLDGSMARLLYRYKDYIVRS